MTGPADLAACAGAAAGRARGTLFLVVGPSGVGKDTLIDRARATRPDLVALRRVVTRPADAGGEAIDSVDEETFRTMEAAGAFALAWRAHGLAYGVPYAAAEALAAGRDVIANVSRGVVHQAQAVFDPVRVIVVTAAPEVRAARLAARGRESAEEIRARLSREAPPMPSEGVTVVRNDGTLEEAVAAFLAALQPRG
ncbi:MAG: phosphonate metabolism protein/1,5-bisphosphokinase (PRPP-forming) PhnN [Paracoccaceae bacterium]